MQVGSNQKEALYRLGNRRIAGRMPTATVMLGLTTLTADFAVQLEIILRPAAAS